VKNCERCGGVFQPYRPLQKYCQPCRPIVKESKRRAYYVANKENVLAGNKAWYEANKGRVEATNKAWRAANKDRYDDTVKAWNVANKARLDAHYKTYREENAERIAARGKAWREANPDREAARRKSYYEANKPASFAKSARRRAGRLKATPPWQSTEELDAIWEGRPEGFHVDHIHPLKGKHSCGLNVPWNLNYLPDTENKSKGNKQPQPGYFDWFSEAWTVHAAPVGRVWTPTDYDNI
jgi:hypothetical protein